ncbi:hypothetical protein [Rosenbergiella collisarenosi]|uniref:hypothetical protein n=1 Tax=Rosenbergiella collisarenosi TaxID=1544695 RepID=UPI001F4E9D19|nr:hypothetical protein [Rosenbergiella collisarenosi]
MLYVVTLLYVGVYTSSQMIKFLLNPQSFNKGRLMSMSVPIMTVLFVLIGSPFFALLLLGGYNFSLAQLNDISLQIQCLVFFSSFILVLLSIYILFYSKGFWQTGLFLSAIILSCISLNSILFVGGNSSGAISSLLISDPSIDCPSGRILFKSNGNHATEWRCEKSFILFSNTSKPFLVFGDYNSGYSWKLTKVLELIQNKNGVNKNQ